LSFVPGKFWFSVREKWFSVRAMDLIELDAALALLKEAASRKEDK
jgi:hypothetical protein